MRKKSEAKKKTRVSKRKADVISTEPSTHESRGSVDKGDGADLETTVTSMSPAKKRLAATKVGDGRCFASDDCCFVGDPVAEEEAKLRWPHRYVKKSGDDVVMARQHFLQAKVDNQIYNLNDSAYVEAGEGKADYICQIVEFFEARDRQLHFTAQWLYRAEDTVMKEHGSSHDAKRVFLSEYKNDNPLNCLLKKIEIIRISPNVDLSAKAKSIPLCDLYYDMTYSVQYSTFANLPSDDENINKLKLGSSNSTHLSQTPDLGCELPSSQRTELSLLDLYSGCGGMSTGLCLGANLSGANLQTKWAVDLNSYACESLKVNHPYTEVRNEEAQDFLSLLREWEKLCLNFDLGQDKTQSETIYSDIEDEPDNLHPEDCEEFEVGRLVGICYGKTNNLDKRGLKFKVRWKGYGPKDDTWEPIENLSKCQESIEDYVRRAYQKEILPLPGTVDIICGGPPCQGISGLNMYRNSKDPLEDEKNKQLVVFMNIVDYLKPKYVLMENVVDMLKFSKGYLGRYALSRLVAMNYQSRLGIVAAGCYGLPQFRMRVFLWGALPNEQLPQFPLPTHEVVVRGACPVEFSSNLVGYEENQHRELKNALTLSDAISDLPSVTNDEERDVMDYNRPPQSEFQKYIRQSPEELMKLQSQGKGLSIRKLFDHRPYKVKEDDYLRVIQIPKRKGANFRDLPGLIVGENNKIMLDPAVDRHYLASRKPLVPNYAISFMGGKSTEPFARIWWDETVPTVVTRPEPHNRKILHPEQDRVLTIRENARLQGFPDYYRLIGPVKERYIQVGNAVAVNVSRALGYALGMALQGKANEQPLFILPDDF